MVVVVVWRAKLESVGVKARWLSGLLGGALGVWAKQADEQKRRPKNQSRRGARGRREQAGRQRVGAGTCGVCSEWLSE